MSQALQQVSTGLRWNPAGRWPLLLAVCALAYLVLVVFSPMLGFQFVQSDVIVQVVDNPHIRGLSTENVWHILTQPCITSYYPVRTLTYAIDYQIWGLNAAGFKLTGGLVHLANVLLVFWLMLRLFRWENSSGEAGRTCWDVLVAAFSASVFAVHPVVVEPVVWVSGREELLMTLGALGCLHCHLTARRLSQTGGNTRRVLAAHAAAAVCCLVACLSNAVAAVIPMLIVAWDVLMLDRPKWRKILFGTAPLWAIALLTVTLKGPGNEAVLAREVGTFSLERVMLVLNVYWLNLQTLVWPTDLAISYNRLRPDSFLAPGVLLGGVVLGLTLVVLGKLRRQRLMLFAVLWFGLALGPTCQVMPHHIHRADRFLYLPLVGMVAALGLGLKRSLPAPCRWLSGLTTTRSPPAPCRWLSGLTTTRLESAGKSPANGRKSAENAGRRRLLWAGVIGVGVSCLIVLDILSAYQVQTWRDSVAVWTQCVKVAPENAEAHRALADSLAKRHEFSRAFYHYEEALQLEPDYVDAIANYAYYLVTSADARLRNDALNELAVEHAQRGCELTGWRDLGLRRTLAVACTHCAIARVGSGRFQPAIEYYRKATAADPNYELAQFNLAFLLATCADPALRDPPQAVRLAERALGRIEHPDPVRLSILAASYAAAKRFEEAITAAEKAVQLAASTNHRELPAELRRQLQLYQNHTPYRPPRWVSSGAKEL